MDILDLFMNSEWTLYLIFNFFLFRFFCSFIKYILQQRKASITQQTTSSYNLSLINGSVGEQHRLTLVYTDHFIVLQLLLQPYFIVCVYVNIHTYAVLYFCFMHSRKQPSKHFLILLSGLFFKSFLLLRSSNLDKIKASIKDVLFFCFVFYR